MGGPAVSHYFVNAGVGRSVDGTAANTRLFINAWRSVKAVGRWELADFTIKADPDAVLIADRLRWHLKNFKGQAHFVMNCVKPQMGSRMFGSVEAISLPGMKNFFGNWDQVCMGLNVDAWGEDRWLENCMYAVGTQSVADFGLVSDGLCSGLNCQ